MIWSSSEFSILFLSGGYVEALEVRCETLDQEFVRTKSTSENTYDDVENPSKNG